MTPTHRAVHASARALTAPIVLAPIVLAPIVRPVSVAEAQSVLEDFEHGSLDLYTMVGHEVHTAFVPAAAHDGSVGAAFSFLWTWYPAWHYRTDLPTGPGTTYRAYCRRAKGASGNLYLGVGAGDTGTFAAAWQPSLDQRSGTIALVDVPGYGTPIYLSEVEVPGGFADDTWLLLEFLWRADGVARVSLYDETGGSLLASTDDVFIGWRAGGLAIRGWSSHMDIDHFMDTITARPEGSCPCVCDTDLSTGAGVCDFFDFIAFQDLFAAGDPCGCDLDVSTGPGVCDFFDFVAFQDAFAAGC